MLDLSQPCACVDQSLKSTMIPHLWHNQAVLFTHQMTKKSTTPCSHLIAPNPALHLSLMLNTKPTWRTHRSSMHALAVCGNNLHVDKIVDIQCTIPRISVTHKARRSLCMKRSSSRLFACLLWHAFKNPTQWWSLGGNLLYDHCHPCCELTTLFTKTSDRGMSSACVALLKRKLKLNNLWN